MIRRPPRSTHCISSAASDVYKRQVLSFTSLLVSVDPDSFAHVNQVRRRVQTCLESPILQHPRQHVARGPLPLRPRHVCRFELGMRIAQVLQQRPHPIQTERGGVVSHHTHFFVIRVRHQKFHRPVVRGLAFNFHPEGRLGDHLPPRRHFRSTGSWEFSRSKPMRSTFTHLGGFDFSPGTGKAMLRLDGCGHSPCTLR
eukprot:TRINITY_DN24851_c0_g1_i2.p1 TRINITY_DN24851_c0_g1~~TRINITY_DN24851_c0_g1_i2.p1  ORF type:complete len:198 (-),score=-12.03 TRINITY_DN24851_c0_g1_i2:7-600(-)